MADSFDKIKLDLINRIKSYFPDTYSDFHEASNGMMIADLQAFTLHALEEYVDNAQSEQYSDTVKDTAHALAILKSNNIKNVNLISSSRGKQQFTVIVPADSDGNISDDYIPIIKAGTTVKSDTGIVFELLQDLNFSQGTQSTATNLKLSEREVQKLSDGTYKIRKTGLVTSEEVNSITSVIPNEFEAFREVEIDDDNVTSISNVVDSEGNRWYEVDHLSQEYIFKLVENTSSDNEDVPYILTTMPVPRRFVKDFDVFTKKTKLVFGGGKSLQQDQFVVPDLELVTRQMAIGVSPADFGALSPEIFIQTPTLGLSPYNTTLTIEYRVSKGSETNIYSKNAIVLIYNLIYAFRATGLSSDLKSVVLGSFETYNSEPIAGGEDEIPIENLLKISSKYYFSQDRCVTAQDYLAHIYAMPTSLGRVYRAGINYSNNTNETNVLILSSDSDGKLIEATTNLKNNLLTYLNTKKNNNDNVIISDAEIINIKINYSIVSDSNLALTNCNNKIIEKLDITNRSIGQNIVLSELIKEIQSVDGVVSVADIDIYSDDIHIKSLIKDGIIVCPSNAMFQIENPLKDVIGVIL